MTKKNTRSDSHKHIKATLCAAMCSVLTAMPAFATGADNSTASTTTGTTVWTKASEIMRFFEVTGPPLWRLPIFLNVGLICLFGVYVLIVQSPGTREIFLRVLDGRLLALRVQHKHALPTS